MKTTLRFFFLLALAFWLGSLLFFGAVLAPVAFTVLPTTHEAGLIVGASLRHLHIVGLGCGVVLLVTLLLLESNSRRKSFRASLALTVLMMALTSISQFAIMPAMDRCRTRIDEFLAASEKTNGIVKCGTGYLSDRTEFNQLHALSTYVEGGVMFAAIALLALAALPPRRDV